MKTQKNKKHEAFTFAPDLMPTDEESLAILRQRANRWATAEIKLADLTEVSSYVRFTLNNNEYYGIPYERVNEVLQKTALTKLPLAPPYVSGVMNRRGKLLTVINIKKFFQLRNLVNQEDSAIIVVEVNGMTIGIEVDHVEGSTFYDETTLDMPFSSAGGIKQDYITGIHQGKTAIINLAAILRDLQTKSET